MTLLIDKIAEIHFLLSQLAVFTRGSAAISENLTRVIFKYHGFKLSPFKDVLRIDLEAHYLPLKEFQVNYLDFFVTPPTMT